MEKENKLVYKPPRLEEVDLKLVFGEVVPGVSQVQPPDEDPDF